MLYTDMPFAGGPDCQPSTGVIEPCVSRFITADKHDIPVMVKGPLVLQIFYGDLPAMYKSDSDACMDFLMDLHEDGTFLVEK